MVLSIEFSGRVRFAGLKLVRNGGENALALVMNWTASVTGAKALHGEPPQTLICGFSVVLPGCIGGIFRAEDPGAKNCNCTLKRVLGVEPIVTDRPNSSVWRNSRVPVPWVVLLVITRVVLKPDQSPVVTPVSLITLGFQVKK